MTEASRLSWFYIDERWDDKIQDAGIAYHTAKGIYPNVFIASTKTHDYINKLAAA